MTSMTRRTVAKGAAWAIPTITVGAAAPAQAASTSPTGPPIVPSMLQFTYFIVTSETLGGVANKKVAFDFGYKVIGAPAGSSIRTTTSTVTNAWSVTLSNGKTYRADDGLSIPASGTVGTVDGTCQGGYNGTQACGTTGASAVNVENSTGTNGYHVTAVCMPITISVTGYATTTLYVTASGFPGQPGSADRATSYTTNATPC